MGRAFTLKWRAVVILVAHVMIASGKDEPDTSLTVSDRKCSVIGGECDSIQNAHCCDCCALCRCDDGYGENPIDGISCELDVSAVNCTSGGTECDTIDDAFCKSTTMKCTCNKGYDEKANTCVESAASSKNLNGNGILFLATITIVMQWLFHRFQ